MIPFQFVSQPNTCLLDRESTPSWSMLCRTHETLEWSLQNTSNILLNLGSLQKGLSLSGCPMASRLWERTENQDKSALQCSLCSIIPVSLHYYIALLSFLTFWYTDRWRQYSSLGTNSLLNLDRQAPWRHGQSDRKFNTTVDPSEMTGAKLTEEVCVFQIG